MGIVNSELRDKRAPHTAWADVSELGLDRAELSLRGRIAAGLLEIGEQRAAERQARRMSSLLPRLSDQQLEAPRDEVRILMARLASLAALAARDADPFSELHRLVAEFRQRVPPDTARIARCLAEEGVCLQTVGRYAESEARLNRVRLPVGQGQP